MSSHENKALQAQNRFQDLLKNFQKANAARIIDNSSPPSNTGEAFKFVSKSNKENKKESSDKKANARSKRNEATAVRKEFTPSINNQSLQSSQLFNLGF